MAMIPCKYGTCNIYYHSYGTKSFTAGTNSFALPSALSGKTVVGVIGMIDTYAIPSAPIDASGSSASGWGSRIDVSNSDLRVYIGTGGSFTNKPFHVIFFYI